MRIFKTVSLLFSLIFQAFLASSCDIAQQKLSHASQENDALLEDSAGLSSLEDVLQKHNIESFRDFYANAAAKQEYYTRAAEYFGWEDSKRRVFDTLLDQANDLVTGPGGSRIAERLWQQEDLGTSYAVKFDSAAMPAKLNLEAFANLLREIQENASRLKSLAPSPAESLDSCLITENLSEPDVHTAALAKALNDQRDEILAKYGVGSSELSVSAQKKYSAELAALKSREKSKINCLIYAAVLHLISKAPRFLRTEPDAALEFIRSLPETGEALFSMRPFGVREGIRALVPKIDLLRRNTEIFIPDTLVTAKGKEALAGALRVNEVKVFRMPRAFHGVWKGFKLNECVGGSCSESLSPERWGTVLLKGAKIFYFEVNGRYHGFVELIPIKVQSELVDAGQSFASVNFGSFDFSRNVLLPGSKGKQTSFYSVWFEQTLPRLKDWGVDGLVKSESTAAHNAQALPTVMGDPSYVFGKLIGVTEHVSFLDDLQKHIIGKGPQSGDAAKLVGRMITDVTASDSGNLTLLQSFPAWNQPAFLMERFQKLDSKARSRGFKFLLGKENFTNPELQTVVAQLIQSEKIVEELQAGRYFNTPLKLSKDFGYHNFVSDLFDSCKYLAENSDSYESMHNKVLTSPEFLALLAQFVKPVSVSENNDDFNKLTSVINLCVPRGNLQIANALDETLAIPVESLSADAAARIDRKYLVRAKKSYTSY